MQNWLAVLQNDIETITGTAAMEFWPGTGNEPYYNYRLEHVKQTDREARKLLSLVGGDEEIVLASVWIHDRFQPQYTGEGHAEQAADWVVDNLENLGFPAYKVPAVRYAVGNHSSPYGTIPGLYHEARILWDADKLSHLGALWVVNFLCGHRLSLT